MRTEKDRRETFEKRKYLFVEEEEEGEIFGEEIFFCGEGKERRNK